MPKKKELKILVVEDDKMLREIITGKLIREGIKVLAVLDGESGIEEAKKEKFDLILLDLLLPKMSGFDVLKEIRTNSNCRSIPIIIVSNLGQQHEVDKAMKSGATDYLVKANFGPDEIVDKIRTTLKKSPKKSKK